MAGTLHSLSGPPSKGAVLTSLSFLGLVGGLVTWLKLFSQES